VKYFSDATATLVGLDVMSKNEQVKQIRVNFYLFETSYVNSFGMHTHAYKQCNTNDTLWQ